MEREYLYPKNKRDNSNKRWLVIYASLLYFGAPISWETYYRTKTGAKLAAWWYWSSSYRSRGSVTLHDTWSEE